MGFNFSLMLLIASIFFFGLFICFSFIKYKKEWNKNYSLLNQFPYEMYEGISYRESWPSLICLCAFTILKVAYYVTYDFSYSNGFYILIMASGVISSALLFALVITSFKNTRKHLLLLALSFAFSFALGFGEFFHLISVFKTIHQTSYVILAILTGILLSVHLFFLFNPNLSLRVDEKEAESNANRKGKVFIPALLEWSLLILSFGFQIIALLMLVF